MNLPDQNDEEHRE